MIVYFNKDHIKDFVTRLVLSKGGPTIHQFHPEILLHSSTRQPKTQQIVSNERTYVRSPANTQSKSMYTDEKREQISAHLFMNLSNKDQNHNSIKNDQQNK